MSFSSAQPSAILVGQFDDFETAKEVSSELQSAGYRPQDIEQFALNAPGAVAERPAGVRVAVRVPATQLKGRVLGVFSRHDARSIEEARGTWQEGQWRDFDPVSVPRWIMPPQR
jgi:hypothetical protein